MNNLSDNEIIKALEYCKAKNGLNNQCDKCSFHGMYCMDKLVVNVLDLINRQKAEIERLQTENRILSQKRMNLFERLEFIEKAKVKAVKKFADKVKGSLWDMPSMFDEDGEYEYVCMESLEDFIDNLVKEMVGEG